MNEPSVICSHIKSYKPLHFYQKNLNPDGLVVNGLCLLVGLNSEVASILKLVFHFNLFLLLHTESLVKVEGIERTQHNTHSSQTPVCDNLSSHPS